MNVISEAVTKKRGRPASFTAGYLDSLGGYFRSATGERLTRRSLQDKAYFIRCIRVLFGDDVLGSADACPMLKYLADPRTNHCRVALMARLGRIRDEHTLVETALGACFFQAAKDADLEEIHKAWQVLKVWAVHDTVSQLTTAEMDTP